MPTIEDRGLISDVSRRPANEGIAYFTSLFRSSKGTWVAGSQTGTIKHGATNSVRLFTSPDGRTWSDLPSRFETSHGGVPGSLAGAEIAETRPGEWMLTSTWFDRSDPDRPLFDPVTEGILRSRQLKAFSTDEGRSWTPWEVIDTKGLTGTGMCGPAVAWPDGTLAFPFESFKDFDDPAPPKHAAWLLISKDRGRTFETLHKVGQDPQNRTYYWDQRLCPAGANGEYFALFWTHDRTLQKDLRVHVKLGSIHDDGGSLPTETTIPGQIAAPLWLGDGRCLAFVVDRSRPATMSLWLSKDGGKSWPESERVVVYNHDERASLSQGMENVDFAQYWEDMGKWTFGHPAIRHMGDGRALCAWYAGAPGRFNLHWAVCRV